MALSKLFVVSRSVAIAEHVAFTAFKTIFGRECGWLHRTIRNNNWKEKGIQPLIQLSGCVFLEEEDGVKKSLVDVVVTVLMAITHIPVEGSEGVSVRHDVVSVEVKTTQVVKGKRSSDLHRFTLKKLGESALPCAPYELIRV
jgi:hypothetical protein